MDRRDAAERAEGEVERRAGLGVERRDDGRGLVARIGDVADPIWAGITRCITPASTE